LADRTGPPSSAPALDRGANLLGALSLVIADRMADAMAAEGGRPESGAAALCALLHFLDRPSVDLLRQVLGLTSSGTVRLVDKLAESGYVARGPGADGRSVSVFLTEQGRQAAQRVADSRARVLKGALAVLPSGWPTREPGCSRARSPSSRRTSGRLSNGWRERCWPA
jgi:hypothetical protein